MRIVQINVYQFNELSEDAKKEAIKNLQGINVSDLNWWESTYEDANIIGLKLKSFDLDRNRHATGEFLLSACEVAQNIFNNHSETCDTRKTAEEFMQDWQPVFNDYMDENSENYESSELEDKLIDLEGEFLQSILEDYSIMLQKEYEYLTSEEAIIETIEANEYEFTEEGEIYF